MDENTNPETDYIAGEVLLFNKPYKWTSFDVVNRIRKKIGVHLGIKKLKVGHAGTLDPLATGLVILCTGKKTKEIEKYQAQEKEYIANVHFGATTPSFDLESEINEEFPTEHITEDLLLETLTTFIGKQEQQPPIFSAKKVNGQRAYVNARKGKKVELKKSEIEIFEIELLEFALPEAKIRISCSKGTYIRSFANDIGRKLNGGAYLSGLKRTKIGNYNINNAQTIEEFEKKL